jgi:DNA polymerase elongation subunit (family B)
MSYISAIKTGDDVLVWERTTSGRELRTFRAPYNFYIKDPRGTHTSMYGDKLRKYEFDTSSEFRQAKGQCEASRVEMFESDIPPELKILSEHYYNVPAPTLNISLLDIEVDYNLSVGFASVSNPYAPINSVAIYHAHQKRYVVLAVPPNLASHNATSDSYLPGAAPQEFIDKMHEIAEMPSECELDITLCKNEKELLLTLLAEIEDSDVLSGWNSDFFDIPYIGKRLLNLGKRYFRMLSFPEGQDPSWREVETYGVANQTLDLSGRISADYMVLFRKYEMEERPSYKLENIAAEILPDLPKLEYEGSLAELYRSNFEWFVRYNIRDTEILNGFEERLGYIELANQMMHLSTGVWKHVTGTLKLAELAMINYCHHTLGGLIVNDTHPPESDGQIQGAYVLEPKVGMHEWIGSVDINSLYPSAIRSINISPETIRGQFVEDVRASEEIAKESFVSLTLEYENGEGETHTAYEWREILRECKWAVSGYGTVFDQDVQGIIPKILEDWYATRKKYQKLKKEARNKAASILDKYK